MTVFDRVDGFLTACPLCVLDRPGREDCLTFQRPGIVSCRFHGEMLVSDIPALGKSGRSGPQSGHGLSAQTRSVSSSERKS